MMQVRAVASRGARCWQSPHVGRCSDTSYIAFFNHMRPNVFFAQHRWCYTSASNTESPYDILGVQMNATAEEIRAAYLARAKILHPDNQAGVVSQDSDEMKKQEEAFKELQGAWYVLGDAARRQEWDTYGEIRVSPADWSPRMWSLLQKSKPEDAVVMPNWGPSEPPMWLAMFGLASALGGAMLWNSRHDIAQLLTDRHKLRNGGWVCPRCLLVNEKDAFSCQRCSRSRDYDPRQV